MIKTYKKKGRKSKNCVGKGKKTGGSHIKPAVWGPNTCFTCFLLGWGCKIPKTLLKKNKN